MELTEQFFVMVKHLQEKPIHVLAQTLKINKKKVFFQE